MCAAVPAGCAISAGMWRTIIALMRSTLAQNAMHTLENMKPVKLIEFIISKRYLLIIDLFWYWTLNLTTVSIVFMSTNECFYIFLFFIYLMHH